MTAPETAPGRGVLLQKLMAAVRAEFRVEVFVPDPDEPVLGVKECLVDGCDRSVSENGLCSAHGHRWRRAGCPDVNEFAADPGPVLHGRSQPGQCTVTGCGYGVNAHGLCMRHYGQWKRAGPDFGAFPWAALARHPALVAWLDRQPPSPGRTALVIGCGLGDDAQEVSRRGYRVTACDRSPTAIDRCRETVPRLRGRVPGGDGAADEDAGETDIARGTSVSASPRSAR